MVNWFDGLPFRIKTTNMVGAVPTVGYHFSEKEIIKEKSGYFLSWSLRGCYEPASQARGLAWILEPGIVMEVIVEIGKTNTYNDKYTGKDNDKDRQRQEWRRIENNC